MSGVLALATGALRGVAEARDRRRERQLAEEERSQRKEALALQRAAQTLGLLNQPGVSLGGAGEDVAEGAPAGPPAGVAGIAPPAEASPTPRGGMLDVAFGAVRPLEAPRSRAGSPATAGPPAAVGGPQATASASQEPLEIARIALGGQELPIRFDPSRSAPATLLAKEAAEQAEQEHQRRAAFNALHRADPEAFPEFVPGFEYSKQLADYLEDVRTGRRDEQRERLQSGREAAREDRSSARATQERARQASRAKARTRAVNMLASGASVHEVAQVFAGPYAREFGEQTLSFDDVRELAREVNQTRKGGGDEKWKERRDAWEKSLKAPPATELEQDILDALADGMTKEEILAELGRLNSPMREQAEFYLKGRAQYRR